MNVTSLAIEKLKEVMEGEDENGSALARSGHAGRPGFAIYADHGERAPG